MRKPIIAGNWKMYKTVSEAKDFATKLKPLVADVHDRTILVCPPLTHLQDVCDILCDSNVAVGAQNLFWEDEGAFTGEVSAPMLKSVGCTYVIIGHSERRQYFGETDGTVNKKIFAALKHNLLPIVCVGETLEQREKNETFKVIERQIKEGTKGLGTGDWEKIIIAYEPVWAIGTGKTATPEQAQEVHAYIRKLLPKDVAANIRILYGGSVKPENIKELMAKPDIDGGLVGGASLKVDSFVKLIKY
ncbi:MAG: triose-phosphate isomerase [Candidatus Margulisbacteria bacterium]|nr:triose-phosphate isomerase [Candidatus Margulisiibacteriota bacterium]